jgi:GT2 family glycosyltransferase
MQPLVSFVLPTRNRPTELARTIEHLGTMDPVVPAEVIVVDNHSQEPATLPARLPNGWRACTLRRPRNEGAAARNDGVRIASAKWIVMLDDDSYPLDMRFVEAIEDAEPDVAAIGAEILLPDGAHEQGGLPEVIVGCGAAIRREAFMTAGGYDPAFHFYVEEYDLCARFLLGGKRIIHDPRFRVLHTKTPTNRDMGLVLGRLMRNNGWVLRRYAPDRVFETSLRETIERYEGIARKEHALDGYERGLAEFRATVLEQRRVPMDDELWARFTGETAARATFAKERGLLAGRRVAVVDHGKAGLLIESLVREFGGKLVPESDAETLVIGTLSPGPMLDAQLARAQEPRPVLAPWSFAARPVRLRRAG